ncbi:MAG TPA: branched-chain amino acid ABC transporter permease, partial [Alcaligenaceae bacterium]|nr:branched-chain amino acid ABC transporter permease [Alcaligenaceae bacterium]
MRIRVNQILPLFCLALLIVFPLIAPALNLTFYVSFIRRVMIFALAATSLNFILGYGGMVALGHAAFFGAGAYVVAILSAEGVVSALIAWPAAIVIAGLLALVVGAISLRTRGVYFIMITLAFAQMVYYIFISLRKYGGEDGINLSGHSKLPDWLSGLSLADDVTFYYVVLLIVVLSLIILNRLVASHFG